MATMLRMRYERTTKRTYVFTEEEDNSGIRTLYIAKSFFVGGDKPPARIGISVCTLAPNEKEFSDGNLR